MSSVRISTPNPSAGAVSVVIPAYNYERYLGRAIDSVLKQSRPAWEIIVIDDGSTDGTAALVSFYGDKVRYVHQANAGLSAARNAGIRLADGEYVALLDADDEWLPDFLERSVQALSALPPEYAMTAVRSRYIDAQSRRLLEKRGELTFGGDITLRDLLLSSRFPADGVLIRKSVFEDCGVFDPALRSSEDRDMWIRIAAQHKIHLIPEAHVLVRRHGESMISNVDRMKQSIRTVIRKSYRQRFVPGWHVPFWLRVMAVFYYQTALMYMGARRWRPAMVEIAKSLLCWPLWLNPREINTSIPFVRSRALVRIALDGLGIGSTGVTLVQVAETDNLVSLGANDGVRLPGISAIIPAANYAAYLPKAIDSALAQEYPLLEIIVVDDGSTDNTRAVVAEYGDRVRYLYQDNAGLSAARNTGIRAATHDFVALLDADDVWLPGKLRKIMAAFSALPPEFAVVASQSRYVNAAGQLLEPKINDLRLSGEVTQQDILLGTRFFPSAAITKKSALLEAGLFDTGLRCSEDRDMWIRIGARHRLHLLAETLVHIRKHDRNMSLQADRMKANQRRVLLKSFASRGAQNGGLAFWLKVAAAHHYHAALMYLGTRRLLKALANVLLSLCCWPLVMAGRELGSGINLVRLRTLARVCLYHFRSKAARESVLLPDHSHPV